MPVQKWETKDGKLFDSESEALDHEVELISEADKRYDDFMKGYNGRTLAETWPGLQEIGIWEVRGEDPNCDFHGPHHKPHLFTVEGRLFDVVQKAVARKDFWTWGAGGEITKVDVKRIEDLD